MRAFFITVLALIALSSVIAHDHHHYDEAEDDAKPVTCGSTFKLRHVASKYQLHSHPINWGSGSGQQSVTGFIEEGDSNSLWAVREGFGMDPCTYGRPIKCGATIRLNHAQTGRFLHSHNHRSPLSGRQEVSGFGSPDNSNTDDSWRVECPSGGSLWLRGTNVAFKHVATGAYLFTRRMDEFTNNNCPGCPIVNQLEISANTNVAPSDSLAQWRAYDGIYYVAVKDEEGSAAASGGQSGTQKDEL